MCLGYRLMVGIKIWVLDENKIVVFLCLFFLDRFNYEVVFFF